MIVLNKRIITGEMIDTHLCKKCRGRCCKGYPCSYYPSDFKKFNEKLVIELIKDAGAVIDIVDEDSISGLATFSYLSLRARGIIDMNGAFAGVTARLSRHNRCIHLKANGCGLSIAERPGEGLYLIPKKDECIPSKEGMIKEKEWYRDIRNQCVLYEVINRFGENNRLRSVESNLCFVKKNK